MKKFTADFETTTDANDCRVWAWAVCEVGAPENFWYGNSINTFFDFLEEHDGSVFYFHNIKFDGEFCVNYLYKNNYTYLEDKTNPTEYSFSTLISSMGAWYSIDIYMKQKGKRFVHVRLSDSLKILNFSVAQIAKDFDLPISKLTLDYDEFRPVGHKLTSHEVAYIRNDVEIMARALDKMFSQGHTKMTIGSDALSYYKNTIGDFKFFYPELPNEVDAEIRESYKGGFTYLSPKYAGVKVGHGITLDINSMYPAQMYNQPLPILEPKDFAGKYEYDPDYPLYVIQFSCKFDLKKGKIPSIQLKRNALFKPNEYIESSNDEDVTLTLTSVDYELFREQYNVSDIEFFGGYKFKQASGLFKNYIDHFMKMKIESKKAGNKAQTLIAKLFLNSLYGKFGTNPNGGRKIPRLIDNELAYEMIPVKEGERKPVYIPTATFITSYARAFIIRSSQMVRDWSIKNKGYDAYVYSDTDSMKVLLDRDDLEKLKHIIPIDDYELGKWAFEEEWQAGKWLRQKCYIEQDMEGKIHTTIAGLPKHLSDLINFDNFDFGFTTAVFDPEVVKEHGGYKLRYKHVDGGVILQDTDFTIK